MRFPISYSILLVAIAAGSSFGAQPVLAQEEAAFPGPEHTIVALVLEGTVQAEGEAMLVVPASIIEHLTDHEALAKLDIYPTLSASHLEFRAQFVFPSVEDFSRWRESEIAQELMEMINAGQGNVAPAVSVWRYPRVGFLNRQQDQ